MKTVIVSSDSTNWMSAETQKPTKVSFCKNIKNMKNCLNKKIK